MNTKTKKLAQVFTEFKDGEITKHESCIIFQKAIDNGDILYPSNEIIMNLLILGLIEKGELNWSQHVDEFKKRPESNTMHRLKNDGRIIQVLEKSL